MSSAGAAEGSGVLVTAATGALRPAVEALVSSGQRVAALAKTASALAELAARTGADPVAADWSDPHALARAVQPRRPFSAGLLYCPTAPQASLDVLCAAVAGRIVRLLPSAVAGSSPDEPFQLAALGPAPSDHVRVVLGWVPTPEPSWHTPDQISAAALQALHTGTDQVLGVVRPWSSRPA